MGRLKERLRHARTIFLPLDSFLYDFREFGNLSLRVRVMGWISL